MSLTSIDYSAAATKKITADANSELWLGKFRLENDYRRPFGSAVQLRGAALVGSETSILVYPLKEDLPPGTVLPFASGNITLSSGAFKGRKEITNTVVPANAFGTEEVANTSNVEQVITLSADLAVGDRRILINALDELVEAGRILDLPNGIQFKVTPECDFEKGDTEIFGELVKTTIGSLANGTVVATTGATSTLPEYVLVCSADSIQMQGTAQNLTDYIFKDGQDASKDVVTRDRTFTITGKELESDFGYDRIVKQALGGITSGKEKAHCIAVSGYQGRQAGALICIGNESLNAQNNQRNTLNASIEIDGPVTRYFYEHLRVA